MHFKLWWHQLWFDGRKYPMTSSTNASLINLLETLLNYFDLQSFGSRHRTDDMVVGFTTN